MLSTEPQLHIQHPTIRLTENQRKVIEDKYLKGSASVEAWLAGVARNIAFAELLYHPSSHMWGLFDGVRVLKRDNGPGRMWIFHNGLQSFSDRENNFLRFISNCSLVIEKHREARQVVSEWENRFYEMLSTWRFLPNSPTLMNAGRDLQQLSACYVIPVEDSMEGVTRALQAQALIHKSGGGTGFSFERMRPTGDKVKSTEGVASGVLSFMQVFDKMTGVVKQGGNRRGANMGVLPYWHPEIKEFIKMKARPGVMENFNVSVAVDDRFFEAADNNWQYDLINPRTGKSEGQANAKEIFDLLVEYAWKTGDPGLVFIDRLNNSSSNPTPALGRIEATNPCGEQPLLPNEPCNLGSINLSLFVKGELTEGEMDWEGLRQTVYTAVRFLDDVIDVNNYPMPEMELLSKGNRRIGLGVMGWAEALIKLGISYDSKEAITAAKQLMGFINQHALEASEALAKERGVFPNWKNSVYDPQSKFFKGDERKPRHCARTTIAPTGTIGLAAGLQGAGIEPFYGIAYTRYNAKALEAVKSGVAPDLKDIYFEVNPLFRKVAEQHQYFGLKENELWQKIEKNKKSVRGIPEIPSKIQALFATSHDVSVETHVRMQAAFQENTDNAVSKTINMPHVANQQDVKNAFLLAHKLKCKGITIYRDGSKQEQVLNLFTGENRVKKSRALSFGVSSEYYELTTGYGPLHIHIDYDENGPLRLFSSLSPVGTEMAGLTSVLGVMISKFLEEGGNANVLLKHLQSVKGDRPFGLGKNRINSIAHAVAIALRSHLQKHGGLEEGKEEESLVKEQNPFERMEDPSVLELWNLNADNHCPQCFSTNISYSASCHGPVCHDCGHSECN